MALLSIFHNSFPGTVGDALDDDFSESTIGLRKTELINHAGCGILLEKVDVATAAWVDWYTTTADCTEPAEAGHRPSARLCTSWAT